MIKERDKFDLNVGDNYDKEGYDLLAKAIEINNRGKEFVWLQVPFSKPEVLQFINPNNKKRYSIGVPKYVNAGEWIMVTINAS